MRLLNWRISEVLFLRVASIKALAGILWGLLTTKNFAKFWRNG